MTTPLLLELLAYSSCDRSEGNPGKVGPIRFRLTGHPLWIQTTAHDLPAALRELADDIEELRELLYETAPTPEDLEAVGPVDFDKVKAMGNFLHRVGVLPRESPQTSWDLKVPTMTLDELADALDPVESEE